MPRNSSRPALRAEGGKEWRAACIAHSHRVRRGRSIAAAVLGAHAKEQKSMIALRSILRVGRIVPATVLATALVLGWTASSARADTITDENVDAAVAAAKTPADHQALAAFFTAKAEAAAAEADRHERMVTAFRGKGREAWQMHCNSLIRSSKQQAKDYAALANEQTRLAGGK
jgi:hypothetical protein